MPDFRDYFAQIYKNFLLFLVRLPLCRDRPAKSEFSRNIWLEKFGKWPCWTAELCNGWDLKSYSWDSLHLFDVWQSVNWVVGISECLLYNKSDRIFHFNAYFTSQMNYSIKNDFVFGAQMIIQDYCRRWIQIVVILFYFALVFREKLLEWFAIRMDRWRRFLFYICESSRLWLMNSDGMTIELKPSCANGCENVHYHPKTMK